MQLAAITLLAALAAAVAAAAVAAAIAAAAAVAAAIAAAAVAAAVPAAAACPTTNLSTALWPFFPRQLKLAKLLHAQNLLKSEGERERELVMAL